MLPLKMSLALPQAKNGTVLLVIDGMIVRTTTSAGQVPTPRKAEQKMLGAQSFGQSAHWIIGTLTRERFVKVIVREDLKESSGVKRWLAVQSHQTFALPGAGNIPFGQLCGYEAFRWLSGDFLRWKAQQVVSLGEIIIEYHGESCAT